MLYQKLIDHKIIINGDFILKSGKKSNYYIDIKKTISIPSLYKYIIDLLHNNIIKINNLNKYAIIGVPYSGIPFASTLSYKLNIPLLLLRKKQKTYGTEKIIEGETENKDIILIEDVITTGKSILETINNLNKLNYNVRYVFTIFQRKEFDCNILKKKNINYSFLLKYKI
jgi:orotate phosphoribosyltransferase